MSLRKALSYSGLSSSTYYYEPIPRVTKKLDLRIVEKVKHIAFSRPSYGARRIAATLSREMYAPVNRKRVGRVFRVLNWTHPAMKKSEIIRSSSKHS